MKVLKEWCVLLAAIITPLSISTAASAQSPVRDWAPDYTFRSFRMDDFTTLGAAEWRSDGAEVIARAPGGPGWLILNRSYQDVAAYTRFRCEAPCMTGLLLRAQRTSDGGLTGYLVSVADNDYGIYLVTVGPDGREKTRQRLRRGATQMRFAPPPDWPAPVPAPPVPGTPARVRPAPSATPAPPPPVAGEPGVQGGPMPPAQVTMAEMQRPPADIRRGAWNELNVIIDANMIRPNLNWANQIGFGATEDSGQDFGPIALYIGEGSSEVRFKDLSYRDLGAQRVAPEALSPRFRMQRLDDYWYAWDAAVADIDRDGVKDIVAGPFYYLGPDYSRRREIYLGATFNPSNQYADNMVTFAHDWTGDGWPDVLATEGRQMALYVNPRGDPRRWTRHLVAPGVTSELTLLEDIDGDGRPELVFTREGRVVYARYEPADATRPWATTIVSGEGLTTFHGLGVGDVDGDGRKDILAAAGWWAQPPPGAGGEWTYHPQAFGRWSRSEASGGGRISVWDVNGDGLTDVVAALNAHGWGLAWFEQKRAADGAISFVRHMIMDDYTTPNAGGLTFSELHAGVIPADIDGDGITDFVTGKRHWSHRESYTDPDPNGDALLVWYRGARDRGAEGGANFSPEVVHNRSGVGSLFKVEDVDGDGRPDVVTSTNRGTFVFWGKEAGR